MFRRMKSILRVSLAALWLFVSWHSVGAAETNRNFAVWEKEISDYERMDATNPPPKGGIEFIGSSTIGRWKTLAKDFAGQPVFNRGFGGSQIVDSTHFADRIVFPYAPRQVFLRAGGNDLWAGKSADEVFADFQGFVQAVHAGLPSAEIIFISLSPSPSRWKQHEAEKAVNTMVAGFIKDKPYLKYIETYDIALDASGQVRPELFVADQLYFNADGYKLLVDRVRPFVTGAANGTAN